MVASCKASILRAFNKKTLIMVGVETKICGNKEKTSIMEKYAKEVFSNKTCQKAKHLQATENNTTK